MLQTGFLGQGGNGSVAILALEKVLETIEMDNVLCSPG